MGMFHIAQNIRETSEDFKVRLNHLRFSVDQSSASANQLINHYNHYKAIIAIHLGNQGNSSTGCIHVQL